MGHAFISIVLWCCGLLMHHTCRNHTSTRDDTQLNNKILDKAGKWLKYKSFGNLLHALGGCD